MVGYTTRQEIRDALGKKIPKQTYFVLKPDAEKTDSDVFYLTGTRVPNASLAVLKGLEEGAEYALFVPQSSKTSAAWNNPVPSLFDVRRSTQMHVFDIRTMEGYVQRHKRDLSEGKPEVLRNEVAGFRIVKTPDEMIALEHAAQITGLAFLRFMSSPWGKETEASLAHLWEYYALRETARFNWHDFETSFTTIVANAKHARCMHYDPRGHGSTLHSEAINITDHLVVDAGARINGYCADVTRTIPVSKEKAKNGFFKALYNVVLDTQDRLKREVHAGMTFAEVHAMMIENLVDGLVQEGALLSSMPRDSSVYSEEMANLAVHGFGHSIGIDCHDPCPADLNRKDKPDPTDPFRYFKSKTIIPEGAVITIEPGIYPDESTEILKPGYRTVGGIRTEGMFQVLAQGCNDITSSIPKSLVELLAYREKANSKKK